MLRRFQQIPKMLLPALLVPALAAAAPGGKMQLTSPDFTEGGAIPALFTCQGKDLAPALQWRDVPAAAKSLVLIVDDPDAPDPAAPQRTWVHEVMVDVPPTTAGLAQGHALPVGARFGLNDWKKPAWGGPCPPIGRHRYYFKLYAVDAALKLPAQPTKAEVLAAIEGHTVAETVLMGTYQKHP
jgi:Raf kinase inhibitor-like YbhB/YbcL family protein